MKTYHIAIEDSVAGWSSNVRANDIKEAVGKALDYFDVKPHIHRLTRLDVVLIGEHNFAVVGVTESDDV